jgi:hypothetical protein
MGKRSAIALSEAQCEEVSSWIASHEESLPESVRIFLKAHQQYLTAGADRRRRFEETYRELRRALGITASSERRKSGEPLSGVPRGGSGKNWCSEEERLLARRDRALGLGLWHDELKDRHMCNGERIEEKLEKMTRKHAMEAESVSEPEEQEILADIALEEFEQTPEQKAASLARAQAFVAHL